MGFVRLEHAAQKQLLNSYHPGFNFGNLLIHFASSYVLSYKCLCFFFASSQISVWGTLGLLVPFMVIKWIDLKPPENNKSHIINFSSLWIKPCQAAYDGSEIYLLSCFFFSSLENVNSFLSTCCIRKSAERNSFKLLLCQYFLSENKIYFISKYE